MNTKKLVYNVYPWVEDFEAFTLNFCFQGFLNLKVYFILLKTYLFQCIFLIKNFIYLFLAVLGLCRCAGFVSL